MKIHQLSPHIIAKIAAGEVIERPAYAVKELIENAIDEKADEIYVYIEKAGLEKIMVVDNGEGMSKEDLQESIKPHTTSKLAPDDGLIGITTLGFRGEALATLGAVSTLTIKSRIQKEKIGNQIQIKNGEIINISPAGMAPGTTVLVEHLFASVPARKKFLKTPATEFRAIVDIVTSAALAYPRIQFMLHHNKRTILTLPKNQTLQERIGQLLGEEISQYIVPITSEHSYINLYGFLVKPQLHTNSQNKQYIFINNRHISDKLISSAVKEAYGNILESNVYPIFILCITVPFDMVDVNVHPRKEQIKFFNPTTIFENIKQAVAKTLHENNLTFQYMLGDNADKKITKSHAAGKLRELVLHDELFTYDEIEPFRQLYRTYIIHATSQGLVIYDQHAAHERILFEKLVAEFKKQKKVSQIYTLSKPIALKFSVDEKLLLKEYKKEFEKSGFVFLQFKRHPELRFRKASTESSISGSQKNKNKMPNRVRYDDIMLTHIPELFKDRNPEQLVRELLESLRETTTLKKIDNLSNKMLAYLACRTAVKAGDVLDNNQMKKIIEDLEKTNNNATCPHGRPTRIEFSIRQLHRMFKRI